MQDNKDLETPIIFDPINNQIKIESTTPDEKLNPYDKVRLIEPKKSHHFDLSEIMLLHYF
jgi:hypothetical protein